jgi:hypothetical protein
MLTVLKAPVPSQFKFPSISVHATHIPVSSLTEFSATVLQNMAELRISRLTRRIIACILNPFLASLGWKGLNCHFM